MGSEGAVRGLQQHIEERLVSQHRTRNTWLRSSTGSITKMLTGIEISVSRRGVLSVKTVKGEYTASDG